MEQWEYLYTEWSVDPKFAERANELGKHGWELVNQVQGAKQIIPTPANPQGLQMLWLLTFKRRVFATNHTPPSVHEAPQQRLAMSAIQGAD